VKKVVTAALIVFVALLANSAFVQGQETGPVWRMVYYKIKPGQEAEFWKNIREHALPIFEEAKKQSLFVDVKTFVNQAKEHSGDWEVIPGDWDAMLAFAHPSLEALDELGEKAASIYLKHFGSPEAVAENEKKKKEMFEVVAVRFIREVFLRQP